MNKYEKDPLKDIFGSIANDYKDAFKHVTNSNNNQKNLYHIGFFEKISKNLYLVATSINSKMKKLGIPLIISLNYVIYSKMTISEKILNVSKINLNVEQMNLILVGVTVFFYFATFMCIKSHLNSYFMKKFRIIGFTTKDYQLPKFIKMIKTKRKDINETDYHFKTTLTYDYWVKYKDELEMLFNSYVIKIMNYNNDMTKIIIKTSKIRIDYYNECKNPDNTLGQRLKYAYNYLGMDISLHNTIEKEYQTIIEFNSNYDKHKILNAKEDLKHRTNIKNLSIQINTNSDYKAIINKTIGIIDFNKLLSEVQLNKSNNLLVGIDKNSNIIVLNIYKLTHAIVGGSAGNGKSNIINGLLISMYYSNLNNVVYCLIDPKRAELKKYKDINNTFYAGKNEDIISLLFALENELKRREEILEEDKFIKDIESYNFKYKNDQWCYIVVVIEEIADLMSKTSLNRDYFIEFTRIIQRLVQAGRSYGFRCFLCTQQPKANILNTTIKQSAITRFAFGTDTSSNSKLILDNSNAVGLKKGELILQHGGSDTFLKAPLVEENIYQLENIILNLENLYKNANNHAIIKTIQTIQNAVNKHDSTIQQGSKNHTNHTTNDMVSEKNNIDVNKSSNNLVGVGVAYAVENAEALLDFYRRVAEPDGKLPSVAKTAKITNKSSTTIQKLRKELINDGKLYINGQSAYLNKDNREEMSK